MITGGFKVHAKWDCGKPSSVEEQNIEHPRKIARTFVSQHKSIRSLRGNLFASVNIFRTSFGAVETILRGFRVH